MEISLKGAEEAMVWQEGWDGSCVCFWAVSAKGDGLTDNSLELTFLWRFPLLAFCPALHFMC